MKNTIRFLSAALLGGIAFFLINGYHSDIPIEEIERKYAYTDSKFLELDGMRVHYRVSGDSGQTVVLLHGTASSLHTWERWTKELAKHYQVISFDLPGFGLTGPEPQNDYTRERYLRFIDGMLKQLNVDSCFLAGNSFGGYMAWSYAVMRPERVKKLILLNSSGYPRGDQPTMAGFQLQKKKWLKPILDNITPKWVVRKSVEVVYFDDSKVTEELVQRYFDLLLREGNRRGLMGKTMQISYDHAEEIKRIGCPTLILWGDRDKLVNVEAAHRFHADIPDSELLIYENMGHIPMEEIPERSANNAIRFLAN